MWSFLGARNLIHLQRAAALQAMEEECRRLLLEGYPVEADRVLDEMTERRRKWKQPQP
jgi:hypothetical protein